MTMTEPQIDPGMAEDVKDRQREGRGDQTPDFDLPAEMTPQDEADLAAMHESARGTEPNTPETPNTSTAQTQAEMTANRQQEADVAFNKIQQIDEQSPQKGGEARIAAFDSLHKGGREDSAQVQANRRAELERIAAQPGAGVMTAEALDKDLEQQGVTPNQAAQNKKGRLGGLWDKLRGKE